MSSDQQTLMVMRGNTAECLMEIIPHHQQGNQECIQAKREECRKLLNNSKQWRRFRTHYYREHRFFHLHRATGKFDWHGGIASFASRPLQFILENFSSTNELLPTLDFL